MNQQLTAEQKLRNVANILKRQCTPTRHSNGRGRMPSYPVDKDAMGQTGLQLAEMILQYLDGELSDSQVDELPF